MGKPGTFPYTKFTGLDLRRAPSDADPLSARVLSNIDLTAGGGFKSRDQLREYAQVDPLSKGLYGVNGVLRCALPARLSAVARPPLGVEYDILAYADNAAYAGAIASVEGTVVWDGFVYACVSLYANGVDDAAGRRYEHHNCPGMYSLSITCSISGAVVTLPATVTTVFAVGTPVHIYGLTGSWTVASQAGLAVTLSASPGVATGLVRFIGATKTSVPLPFQPGRALAKLGEKVWASDARTGDTWFCSTEFGPTDWLAPEDAGFLPTSKHETAGNDIVQGYGAFRNTLAVFYQTTIQLWEVGPDPADHAMSSVVGGAGTEDGNSIANLFGDVVYFGQGGFHSLRTVAVSGQSSAGDIGAPITVLTDAIPIPFLAVNMFGLWSASRGQYLGFYGSTAYVWRYSPVAQVYGWSTYALPFAISAVTEVNGKVYVRRADQPIIYVFDPTFTGEVGFSWEVNLPYFDGAGNGRTVAWKTLNIEMQGTCTFSIGVDTADLTLECPLGTLTGPGMLGIIPIMWAGPFFAPRMQGTTPWSLDMFVVRYDVGAV